MPLIKQDALPVTRDELVALRQRLAEAFQFELVVRGEGRYLFVRSPHDEPDPVADLEACVERVPDWAAHHLTDVFLLGTHSSFHVPGHHTDILLDRRSRLDRTTVDDLRNGLDAQYGVGLHRVPGDSLNLVRLGVRLPRTTITEIDESDLVRIARAVGPLLASGESRNVRIAYLVAENDHLRLLGDELFADVAPRWAELQAIDAAALAKPQLQELGTTLPEPATVVPNPAVEAPRAPKRRPKRVINVTPVIDLETNLDATPDEALAREALNLASESLDKLLRIRGFEVLPNVQHKDEVFSLAAERGAGYPKRVLVKTTIQFEKRDADAMIRHARDLDVDLLIVVAVVPAEDAIRRTVATKVKVIRPGEVAAVTL